LYKEKNRAASKYLTYLGRPSEMIEKDIKMISASRGSCVEHCSFGGYCLNGGICNADYDFDSQCLCPPYFEGVHCEKIPIYEICEEHAVMHVSIVLIALIAIATMIISVVLLVRTLGTYLESGHQDEEEKYEV
jgi:hypothetical protein